MRDLGVVAGTFSHATDINNRGDVVGFGDSGFQDNTAIFWSAGQLHDIGGSQADDVNERGQAVVTYCARFCSASVVSLAGHVALPDLEPSDDPSSSAVALNDRGEVIGTSILEIPQGNGVVLRDLRGVLWRNGQIEEIGFFPQAINEKGQIAGIRGRDDGRRAMLRSKDRNIELGTLGGPSSEAVALNDRGQVAGSSEMPDGTWHAFLWSHGRMRDLGTLGGANSTAVAVDRRGQVIGTSETVDGATHAFLWSRGRMKDLGTLGGTSSMPTDINVWGKIVGTSDRRDDTQGAFLWTRGRMHDLGTLGGPDSSAAAVNDRGQVVGSADLPTGETHAFVWSPK